MKKLHTLSLLIALIISTNNISIGAEIENGNTATSNTITLLDGVGVSWDGADLIDYPTGKPSITMLKITVPPHSKLPLHYHPVINVGYMLQGSLTVTDDKGNHKTISAGEPLIETVNTIHYGENRGDTDAIILVFYAGEKGVKITEISDIYPKE